MQANETPNRNALSAVFAFFATLATYWLAVLACLVLPFKLYGAGPGPQRVVGGLVLPTILLLLGARRKARGLAWHLVLVAAAFGAAALESHARLGLEPARLLAAFSTRALLRFMIAAYALAGLYAATRDALAVPDAKPAPLPPVQPRKEEREPAGV